MLWKQEQSNLEQYLDTPFLHIRKMSATVTHLLDDIIIIFQHLGKFILQKQVMSGRM